MKKKSDMEIKLLTQSEASKILFDRVQTVAKEMSRRGIKVSYDVDISDDSVNASFGLAMSLTADRKGLRFSPGGRSYAPDSQNEHREYQLESIPQLTVDDYSKKHRQAVITVSEPARTITRKVTVQPTLAKTLPENNHFILHFGITLPRRTKYSVANKKCSRTRNSVAKVTAKVPASITSFLVGFDEKHMFVSMLKRQVKTVEEAHAELLPDELKGREDYVRQGEFFFVPATVDEISNIDYAVHDSGIEDADGNETDHYAAIWANCGSKHLVAGPITNSRHKTLCFDRLMRVIPNNEIPGRDNNWD